MVRRIIRGVTKRTEEEKRREAFSKKQTSDAAQVSALLKIVQGTPFSEQVYHVLLRDALMVLYPLAWDTSFKGSASTARGLLNTAHIYFHGNGMDAVLYANRPQDVYWRVFSEMEAQVKAGKHLTADAIGKGSLLRRTDQVTPQDMGYTDQQVANVRSDAEREAIRLAEFRDTVERRMRQLVPGWTVAGISEVTQRGIDRAYRSGRSADSVVSQLYNRYGDESQRSIDEAVQRPLDRNTPSRASPDVFSQFVANVRSQMRRAFPEYSVNQDMEFIRSRYDAGIGIDAICTALRGRLRDASPPAPAQNRVFRPGRAITSFIEDMPPTAPPEPPRRSRTRSLTQNQFIARVMEGVRGRTLTEGAAQHLAFVMRHYRRGASVDDTITAMLARFSD
jgi:hypothetical protein